MCGQFEVQQYPRFITNVNREIFLECFAVEIFPEGTTWAPQIMCGTCLQMLNRWKKFKCDKSKTDKILKFSTPTGWRQPQTREDCYFCMTVVCGFTAKTKSKINYASVSSMTKPVLKLHVNATDEEKMEESSFDGHESMEVDEQDVKESDLYEDDIGVDDIEVYEDEETGSEQTESSVSEVNESDDEYVPVGKKRDQKPFNQKELSDFIRDTGVSKDVREFMASVLIRRGLAQPGTKSSV